VRHAHAVALTCIAAAWVVSLLMPAITARGAPPFSGFDLLLQGWQGTSRGVFAWYANPLFILAVSLGAMNRLRLAGAASGIAMVLGLTSFAVEAALRSSMETVPPITLRAGFYLWLCTLVAMFMWSSIRVYLHARNDLRPR
jgi:hypothetical protein